jgi:hypothetical protein
MSNGRLRVPPAKYLTLPSIHDTMIATGGRIRGWPFRSSFATFQCSEMNTSCTFGSKFFRETSTLFHRAVWVYRHTGWGSD